MIARALDLPRTSHVRRVSLPDLERFDQLAARIDRLTARFACVVIGAAAVIFGGHLVRHLIVSGILS